MPDANLVNLPRDNLLHAINASIGSDLFRHLYVKNKKTGESLDVLDNGEFSCAYFVSVIAHIHGLIDSPHATIATTLNKLEESGWVKSLKPFTGSIVHWPEYEGHEHIGFVLGDNQCVSNDEKTRKPQIHSFTLRDGRQPDKYYTYPLLSENIIVPDQSK